MIEAVQTKIEDQNDRPTRRFRQPGIGTIKRRRMSRIPGKLLISLAIKPSVQREAERIIIEQKPASPTEQALIDGLANHWADVNFKKRFSTAKGCARGFNSPQRATSTPQKRNNKSQVLYALQVSPVQKYEEEHSPSQIHQASLSPPARFQQNSYDLSQNETNEFPLPFDQAQSFDYWTPQKSKAIKYVKIPKMPYGVHSPTSEIIRQSQNFNDIIMTHNTCDPPDLNLHMAKFNRYQKPKRKFPKTRRQTASSFYNTRVKPMIERVRQHSQTINTEASVKPAKFGRLLKSVRFRSSIV